MVTRAQLLEAGLDDGAIRRWKRDGRLHRVHPGVYALGHEALSIHGRLWAALLWAGPGALLSYTTAAWVWRLIETEPTTIHVSSARRLTKTRGVRTHRPRTLEGTTQRGFPVTTVTRTLLDISSMLPFKHLRKAFAEADYRRLLDVEGLMTAATRGRAGGAAARRALRTYLPQLAHTLSALEDLFIELCEAHAIPMPEVNVRIAGLLVDAVWREQCLVVELDGGQAHGTPAAAERDRERELRLRAAGFRVVRYTWRQLTEQPELVAKDLRAQLAG